MAEGADAVAAEATGAEQQPDRSSMAFVLSKIAPEQFETPTGIAPGAEAEVTAEATAEAEPPAEDAEVVEPAVEAEAAPAEAVAPPAEDPRIAELTQKLAAKDAELAKYRTVEQQAQDNAQLAELKQSVEAQRALIAAAKEEYGDDSVMVKLAQAQLAHAEKQLTITERTMQKAEQAEQVTVVRDADTAHRRAWDTVPVMKAIYAAQESKDPAAQTHLNFANVISNQIMAEQNIEGIDWRNTKALEAHYAEVERRLVAELPQLRTKYLPAPAAVAKPAAPVIKPAAVKSPTTMSGIPGGSPMRPAPKVELSKLNMQQMVQFAGSATPAQIAATRRR